MQLIQSRDGDLSLFDPKAFYNFHNDVAPNSTLTMGLFQPESDKDKLLRMTDRRAFSSENWQLLYQKSCDCYFIRNYDYGLMWHVGLTETERSMPRLLKKSGKLGQQWVIESHGEGTVHIWNRLLGNESILAMSTGPNVLNPGMQRSEEGAAWKLALNPTVQAEPDWLADVEGIEMAQAATVSSTSSTLSPTSDANTQASTSSTSSPTSNSNTASSSLKSSSGLSGGGIAGIVIGAVGLAVLVRLLLLWIRSYRKRRPVELQANGPSMDYLVNQSPVSTRDHQEYYNRGPEKIPYAHVRQDGMANEPVMLELECRPQKPVELA